MYRHWLQTSHIERLLKALISDFIGGITDRVTSVQVVLKVSVELVAGSCGIAF